VHALMDMVQHQVHHSLMERRDMLPQAAPTIRIQTLRGVGTADIKHRIVDRRLHRGVVISVEVSEDSEVDLVDEEGTRRHHK
jgi:hypothetical protein